MHRTIMKEEAAKRMEEKNPPAAGGVATGSGKESLRPRPAPVIGVLMQPVDENIPVEFNGVSRRQLEAEGTSYVAASYIKYIETAGAVAMPIDLDLSDDEHNSLFNQLDGLVFPGGSADLTSWEKPYLRTAKFYYDRAKESNARGIFFPIFAICLGFEALLIIASGNLNYFTRLYQDNVDRRRVLSFKPDAENSVLFGSALFSDKMPYKTGLLESPEVDPAGGIKETSVELAGALRGGSSEQDRQREDINEDEDDKEPEDNTGSRDLMTLRSVFSVEVVKGLLATHPIAYFHHHRHLSVAEFDTDDALHTDWNLLATAKLPREDFLEIVAAVEHKKFPFYGMQFHPEKALYEHCPTTRIPHFFLSTLPTLYISAFIALIARRSPHAFKDEKGKFSKSAFAFTPTRTAVYGQTYNFEQVYFFPQSLREEMRQNIRELAERTQQTQHQQPEEYLTTLAG